jgi:hypothetical protein
MTDSEDKRTAHNRETGIFLIILDLLPSCYNPTLFAVTEPHCTENILPEKTPHVHQYKMDHGDGVSGPFYTDVLLLDINKLKCV